MKNSVFLFVVICGAIVIAHAQQQQQRRHQHQQQQQSRNQQQQQAQQPSQQSQNQQQQGQQQQPQQQQQQQNGRPEHGLDQNDIGGNQANPSSMDAKKAIIDCITKLGITPQQALDALKDHLARGSGGRPEREGPASERNSVVSRLAAQQPEGMGDVKGGKF